LKSNSSTPSHLSSSKEKHSTVLLFDSDGFSNYTCYLARGLSKYRDVILYSFSEDSFSITGAAKEKRIKFHYIKKWLPKGYSAIRGIIRVFLLFFILFAVLVRSNYDIVHVQEHLPTFFLFIPVLKLRKKQICWTLHDVDMFNPATGINGRLQVVFTKIVSQPTLMTKYVDKILVHASSLREQMIAKKINRNKINVIRHFDYQYVLEFNDNNVITKSSEPILKEDYVLFLGNIAPWKGIDTLMDAARIARAKIGEKFSLVIAGRPYAGYSAPFFENFVKEDYKFVKIINKYIATSEIPSLVSKCAFLVLPYNNSFQHSVSGVIPLAYTFRKPVIVSNIPSLTEYVEHAKTGLIFNNNDSKQLADYMIELIENSSECKEMGKRAYQKLSNEMSLDMCSKIINNIYNSFKS
jgi:alpha-maltose-1-phosphate synthase